MTVSQMLLSFGGASIVGALFGITLRCLQEHYSFATCLLAFFTFILTPLLFVIMPIATPVLMWKDAEFTKKFNTVTRLILISICSPLSLILVIPSTYQAYDDIWIALDSVDKKFKIKAVKKEKLMVRNDMHIFAGFVNGVSTIFPITRQKLVNSFAH